MTHYKAIDHSILDSEDILLLARYLLGKLIVSNAENKLTVGRIVEVEAYKAPEDKASHAFGNKLTERTSIMFEPAGNAYVYLCYGIHKMLNVVSGPKGTAHALLIRALEPINGIEHMLGRRQTSNRIAISNGPGKLCQAMGVKLSHNGTKLTETGGEFYLAESEAIEDAKIITGPRVGIGYAQECAQWPWRFRIKDNPFTSPPDKVCYGGSST